MRAGQEAAEQFLCKVQLSFNPFRQIRKTAQPEFHRNRKKLLAKFCHK